MLTFAEALSIARNSIKAVSGALIQSMEQEHTLERHGISDDLRLRLTKQLACESKMFGAPKYDHTLAFNDLSTIKITSTIGSYAERIQTKAMEDEG